MNTQINPTPRPGTNSPVQNILRRSTINRAIATAREVLEQLHVCLPPLAFWSLEKWNEAGPEMQEARDCMIGWDITDFGSGRFHEIGRTLFTLRNGKSNDARYPKPYAEKILIEPEGQRSPMHYHRSKREDIVNRGGGNVIVVLHSIGRDGLPGDSELAVQIDAKTVRTPSGEPIRLRPGESLTIPPGTFHQFWAETGTGLLVDGLRYSVSSEVSSVCDDWNDNVFIDPWAVRFPKIEEDEPRQCYLCGEYPAPSR